MIWLIAKKDFLLNLISIRFVISFALCLLVIPFTLVVSIDNYLKQQQVYQSEQKEVQKKMKESKVWSLVRPTIVEGPEALSIFSHGMKGDVGNKVTIYFEEYPLFPQGYAMTQDNPLLNMFFSIDFSQVIAILISLLALVFSYDSITREKEDGTLKMCLTGQVGRISLLAGKLFGLLLTLLPVLLFCYILSCLIVLLNPNISFSVSDWSGILLLFASSVFYMLIFILLGMFISTRVANSSSAMVVSLLCWIWFLFLVPSIAFYLSQSICQTSLYENVQVEMKAYDYEKQNEVKKLKNQIRKQMGLEGGVAYSRATLGVDGGIMFDKTSREGVEYNLLYIKKQMPVVFAYADKKWGLQRRYLDDLIAQQRLKEAISWLSPAQLFQQTASILCRTDANSFLKYMEDLRRYRQHFIRFFEERNLFESISYFTTQRLESFPTLKEMEDPTYQEAPSMQAPPIPIDDLPRFVKQSATFFSLLAGALGRLSAMLALIAGLSVCMVVSFMRYDVR